MKAYNLLAGFSDLTIPAAMLFFDTEYTVSSETRMVFVRLKVDASPRQFAPLYHSLVFVLHHVKSTTFGIRQTRLAFLSIKISICSDVGRQSLTCCTKILLSINTLG